MRFFQSRLPTVRPFCRHVLFALVFLLVKNQTEAQTGFTLSATAFDSHVELAWPEPPGLDPFSYKIWRSSDGGQTFNQVKIIFPTSFLDFPGFPGSSPVTHHYFVEALGGTGVLATSDTLAVTLTAFSDDALLDMVQRYTFRYFWEFGHPVSGMARERNSSGDLVTSGGTGFGIMAVLVAIERGFITRQEGLERLLTITGFLENADRFHGVFPHWMNGVTGNVIPFSQFDDGGDLVETAFLMQGLLCARQFFQENNAEEIALREKITGLWEAVEWDFYRKNGSNKLYWHWSPNYEWQMNFQVRGYNEALIVYLLAIASPTHPVPASLWQTGWAQPGYVNGQDFYGYELAVGPNRGGPLFFAHYSYLGFDPRGIKDAYANYYLHNKHHSLVNRAYCMDNPGNYEGYSADCWGLTASDDPFGYLAHEPNNDNGTISPTAALSSMPYTPAESMAALKHFYRVRGEKLWGSMGFYDAFNLSEDWYATSTLAIDQGPIICMIENYRSGLLWNLFMADPAIQPALDSIGFVEDLTAVSNPQSNDFELLAYPNPTADVLNLAFVVEKPGPVSLALLDAQGSLLHHIYDEKNAPSGLFSRAVALEGLSSGLYFFKVKMGGQTGVVRFFKK
jgi:hypothetical protein